MEIVNKLLTYLLTIKSVFDVSVVHIIWSEISENKTLVGYKEATGQSDCCNT